MIRLKNSIAADVVIVVFLVILLAGACILRWTPTERLEYKAYDAISALKDKTRHPMSSSSGSTTTALPPSAAGPGPGDTSPR
jgi:hypothetical protein